MEIPLLMWVLGCPLIAVVIGRVSCQFREALLACCEQIAGGIEGMYDFAKNGLKNIIGFLKGAEKPKLLSGFFGLLILAIAVLASVAEFRICQKTITVIFPWSTEASMLALALVTLTAATGILAHLANGGVQKAAFVLAALLILTQGLLASQRAIESLVPAGQGDEFHPPLTPPMEGKDEGGLIIGGIDGQVNGWKAPEETTAITPNGLPSILNPTVLLATTAAVLFSTAEVVTFWGGTALGGNALTWMSCWILGGVVLAIWFVPTAPLFLLHLIVEKDRLTKVVLALAEALFAICRLPLKAIEWLHPVSFRRRQWEHHQEKMTYNDEIAHARTGALHEKGIAESQHTHELKMQQLRSSFQISQMETLFEFSALHKEAILGMQRKTIALMHQVSEEAISRIEAEYREELRALIKAQIADITETLFNSTLIPIKMTKDTSQLQDVLTAVHGGGNHNPKRTKGVQDESAKHKESSIDARPAAD